MATEITVNGKKTRVAVEPDTPLLWVIRDSIGLTGTKFGCGLGACGACTVHVDGVPTRSCSLPLAGLGDAKVTTIEGLTSPVAKAVQAAWVAHDVAQCGYCQSGQIMSAVALLASNPRPSDAQINSAMSGNICRCATYQRIRQAIHTAAATLKASHP